MPLLMEDSGAGSELRHGFNWIFQLSCLRRSPEQKESFSLRP